MPNSRSLSERCPILNPLINIKPFYNLSPEVLRIVTRNKKMLEGFIAHFTTKGARRRWLQCLLCLKRSLWPDTYLVIYTEIPAILCRRKYEKASCKSLSILNEKSLIAIPCETVDCGVIKDKIKIGSFKWENGFLQNKNTPIHKSGLLSKVLRRELTVRNWRK